MTKSAWVTWTATSYIIVHDRGQMTHSARRDTYLTWGSMPGGGRQLGVQLLFLNVPEQQETPEADKISP